MREAIKKSNCDVINSLLSTPQCRNTFIVEKANSCVDDDNDIILATATAALRSTQVSREKENIVIELHNTDARDGIENVMTILRTSLLYKWYIYCD